MLPLKVKLVGFKGVKSGMNRDVVELDLSGRRGLVALVGPNGAGKTTLLENLHPYRLMPFHAAGYSPGQFSYYDHTVGDALKELSWEFGGQKYLSEIRIKGSGKVKRTEAYLYLDGAPARSKDGTISDGKTATYDHVLDSILGPPEMFFASLFAAQKRKTLAEYKPGEIKTLLSSLLGLEDLLALAAKADDSVRYLTGVLAGVQGAVRAHDEAKLRLNEATERRDQAKRSLQELIGRRQTALDLVMTRVTAVAEAKAKAATLDENARRRDEVLQRIRQLDVQLETANATEGRERRAAEEMGRASAQRAEIAALERRISDLHARIVNCDAKLDALPDEAQARADAVRADQAIALADSEIVALTGRIAELAPFVTEVAEVRGLITGIRAERKGLEPQIAAAEARAALVTKVPCAGMQINSECALLANARGAAEDVRKMRDRLAAIAAEDATLLERGIKAKALADEHAAKTASLMLVRQRKEVSEIEKRSAAARISQVEAADGIRAMREAAVADHTSSQADRARKLAEIATIEAAAAEAKAQAGARYAEALAAHTSAVALERVILAGLPADAVQADTLIAEAQKLHEQADNDLAAVDRQKNIATGALATSEAQVVQAQKEIDSNAAQAAQAAALEEEVAGWRLLARGLGKDGIVALTIDDAGPSISTIANELLRECYGPRFSIRFDTQDQKKDGTMRETFDIVVLDAEKDTTQSISDLSGGQQIWINEALSRAIALFKAQGSGKSYQTIFSDEADGALDPERKQHFMRMKRRVLDIGRYDVEYFVSHTPEMNAQADSIIDVGAMCQ